MPFMLFMFFVLPMMGVLPVMGRIGHVIVRRGHVGRKIVRLVLRITITWRAVSVAVVSWVKRFVETRR